MNYERVRLTAIGGGIVRGERVLAAGETTVLDANTAREWVDNGRAEYTTRVRSLRECLLIGRHVLTIGQEAEVSETMAVYRANAGDVEVLDRAQLFDPEKLLASPAPRTEPAPPPDPHRGEPRVRIKALSPFMVLGRSHAPDGDATADAPESRAAQLLAAGAAELVHPAALTERGRVYLSRLKTRHRGENATY